MAYCKIQPKLSLHILEIKSLWRVSALVYMKKVTTGDIAYLANMYYADFYPDPLKDEASCFRAAYKSANDP